MGKPWWRRANVLVGIFFWCAVTAAIAWYFSSPSLVDTRILPAYTTVNSVSQEKGTLRVDPRVRAIFRIASTEAEVREALDAADNSGRSVSWRLHLDGASFDEQRRRPQYWVESFEYQGRKYGPWPSRARWSWRSMPAGHAALVRGLAHVQADQRPQAIEQLGIALASESLDTRVRAMALGRRGDAREAMAYAVDVPPNASDDELLMLAIDDYRQARKLDPENFNLVMDEGNASAALGAYEEAMALFDMAARKWPDEYFYVAMRRASVRRQIGDAAGALRIIDDMVREHGDGRGMMFSYHRGWTLNELGRYEDAIRQLGAGIETQPDYPWAYSMRACAKGQLGRIDDAIADQTRAVELHDIARRAKAEGNANDSHGKLLAALRALEQAKRDAPQQPTAAACHQDNDPRATKRELSPLFRKAPIGQ